MSPPCSERRWFGVIFLALAAVSCGLDSSSPPASRLPERAAVVHEERISPTTTILDREDGTSTAVITAAPHAWRDGEQWRPIDTTLRRVDGAAVADQNLLVARLPARLGNGQAVRFEDRQSGAGFSWRPRWAQPSDEVQLAGETARYPLAGAQTGAVEEFRVLRGAVKHNLVLASRDVLERVLRDAPGGQLAVSGELLLDPGSRLEAAGGVASADGSFVTSGAIEVISPRGTRLALPAPRAFELGGARRSAPARYRWSPHTRTLSVEVDAAWLRAAERSFPLAIDPPATVLSSYTAQVLASSATGPGTLVSGPDAVRLGALNFGVGVDEYYQFALKFDVSALSAATTVSAVSVNIFYPTTGTANSQVAHFARLTRDPETTEPGPMWTDGAHLANPDYAVLPSQSNNCGCWINAGNPATQTGTSLGATAVADLQAALPSGRFLLVMHVPTYVSGSEAEPHGLLQPNEPQLYVDFTTGLPTVSGVTPAFTPSGTALTATVLGTNLKGQTGTTATLLPILGGAPTPVTVTYVSAGKVRITVPTSAPIGVYDVVVTTATGSSAVSPADRFTVLAPARTWNGAVSIAWSDPNNWTPAGVPDLTTDVIIPGATPFSPTNDVVAGAAVHALSLTGGTLSSGGHPLTVTEDLALSAGTLDMTAGGTLFLSGNNFLNSGTFTPGTGTVNFASPSRGRQSFVATGKVFFDDFERVGPAWTAATSSGTPNAWVLTEKSVFSPIHAWYQQGKQLVAGSATLTSPSFSLAGKTTATLRWKHRYRINLEAGAGPNSGDGFVVQVSTNGGGSWTTIAPNATSVGPKATKSTSGTCAVGGGAHTLNPVVSGPGGIFAGVQSSWVQETVNLSAQAGQASVQLRFWSGWDNCNDYVPYDGLYLDDVSVTADETTLALNHLTLSNSAQVTAISPLQLNGNLDVSTANNELDVNGAGLTVLGTAHNAGTLLRGPGGAFSVAGALTNSGTLDLGAGTVTTGPFTNAGTTLGGTGNLTLASLSNSGSFSTGTLATVINADLSITAGTVLVRGTSLAVTGNLSNSGTLDTGGATTSLTGAAASTVTGPGQYQQSATRQVLFSDGFESGNFTTGGWVLSSAGSPPDPQVVATPPGVGGFVANLASKDAWINNWITRSFSTAGSRGIWLTFGRGTTSTAGNYALSIEYSTDGGANWKVAKTIAGTFTWVTDAINLSALDPAIDNNPNFRFRFHSLRQFVGNYHYIDEVKLEAGTAGLGPLTISGGGTKTIDPTNGALELVVAGPFTLSAGTVRVAGGKALSLDARAAVTSTSAAGTLLGLAPNATLKLSGSTTLTLAGSLELLGLVGQPARVTTTDTLTPGRYALNVGGAFNGSNFDLDFANAAGLNLTAGCVVTALNAGAFHRPPANGALLTLGTANPPAVSTGCSFANELGAATPVSVDGSLNAAASRFDGATGALAGETFDRDFGGATPGNVTWGPVQLAFSTGPVSVAAGSCTAVTVQAGDRAGVAANVAASIVLGLTSTSPGNAFYADASCTSAQGSTATITAPANSVTFYFRDTTAGAPTLTASATGFPSINQTNTITPGPAAKLAFTAQPTATTAGAALSPPVQVTVQDAFGNTVTSSTASITAAIGTNPGGATLAGSLTVPAVSGVASFSTLSLNKTGTGYTLTAASGVLAPATSAAFNINPGAAAQLAFVVQPSSATAGAALAPAVQVAVEDALGNTVTGSAASVTVAIGNNPGGGALSGTATLASTGGVASFSNLSINKTGTGYTLTAVSAGLTSTTSAAFDITAGAASRLAFAAPPSSAVAGVALAPAVQAVVQDALGNTVTSSSASITVAIGTNPGGGALSGTTTFSAASGLASFANLSINKAGTGYTLILTSGTLTAATSGAFDVTAGAAAQLAFTVQPGSVTAGAALPAVQVTVQDALGNTVTSSSASITLAIGTNPGGGALSGTATVAASSGVASFAGLSIDKAGTGYTLIAGSGALTPATSLPFDVTAGTATRLAFLVQPSTGAAGVSLAPAVQVAVQDALGNTVPTGAPTLTVAIGTNPSGGVLSGTLAVAVTAGVATFPNLSINLAGTGYTLTATSGALTSATSVAFNIDPAGAAKLAFTVQPSTSTAGASIAPSVVVTVQDTLGNQVNSTASVTLTIGTNPGGGTLSGTTTVAAVGGVATFSAAAINRSGVGYTLVASSGALTAATSTAFTITAGAPAQLAFTTQPTSAVAGVALAPAVQVAVQDALGNTVSSATPVVTVAIGANPGGGALSGTAAIGALSGLASFSTLSIDKVATGYTVIATSGTLTSATSQPFSITPASAAQLAFTVPPSSATAGVPIAPAMQLAVRDAFGNTVTGSTASVTLAIGTNPAGGALSGPATIAAVGGVASFSSLSLNKAGVGYTLSATSGALTPATSPPFNITPAAAVQLAFLVQPSTVAAGAALAPAIQVAVQDSLGNTVTSSTAPIALAIGANPSSGTLSGTLSAAASGGVATFSTLSLDKTGAGYTLIAASGVLPPRTSAPFNVTPGAAARLAFTLAPSNTTAGAAIAPAPSVTVQDALGNTVTSSTATVAIAIGTNPAAGTLSGTVAVAASGGVASFSNLSINKAAAGYTLVATSAALGAATSPAFQILPGAPSNVAFVTQPTSTGAGVTVAPPVTLAVQDALFNTVTSSTAAITLTISVNPGLATLTGGGVVTAVGGIATFAGLSLDKTGVGYRLDASTPSLPGTATSATFDVTAAPPARLVFATTPLTVTAGACSAQATIGLQDAFGNAATAAAPLVTALASGSATLTFHAAGDTLCATPLSPASISLALGASSAPFRLRDTQAGRPLVTATTAGLPPATQTETIVAGAPAQLTFASAPQTVAAGNCSSPVVVQLEDALGNPSPVVSATTLSLASSSLSSAFFGLSCSPPALTTATVLAGSSTATFHFQDTAAGMLTLTVTGAGLPPALQQQTITGGTAAALVLSQVPATMQAGVPAAFQLTAMDGLGNLASGYSGTVSFTSTDAQATLPPPATFTLANAGTRSLPFTLTTVGTQALTATDAALPPLTVTAGNIQVVAGPVASLGVSGVSSPIAAGGTSNLTVEAQDARGNVASGYLGTVAFSSTDGAATLPAAYTFVAADLGRHTFSAAVTMRTPGSQSVTATDSGPPALTGAQTGVVVLQKTGATCVGSAECGSGQCAQAVCCATACTGTCQACNLAGTEGTCAVVPDGKTCLDPLYCNGAESCRAGVCTGAAPVSCVDPAGRDVLVCDEASQSCRHVLDAPPKIDRDALLTAAVGLPYLYNAFGAVRAAGARPLAFSACAGPTDFRVDALSGAVSWTPGAVGPVALCVKATNAFGEDSVPFTVQVTPPARQGPSASFTVTPPLGAVPLTARFDGSASTADPSSALAAWRWDYGDFSLLGSGTTSTGNYLLPGGYQPQLTVFDEAGRSGTARRPVQVRSPSGHLPPLARIVASAQQGEGQLSVDFSCDCQAGDAPILAWRWDFADAIDTGAGVTRLFEPGRYRVHLTAVDGNGLTAVDWVEIAVARTGGAQPPRCQAELSPPSGLAPLKVVHLASAGSERGQLSSVLQRFADGGSSTRLEVEAQYDVPGRYPAQVTATDDQGLTCQDRVEVVALSADGSVPPRILSRPPPGVAPCGEPFVYRAAVAGSGPFAWNLTAEEAGVLPEGMTLDDSGTLSWPVSDVGVKGVRVRVRVSNSAGSDEQVVEINEGCQTHYGVGCTCGTTSPESVLGLLALGLCLRARRRRA